MQTQNEMNNKIILIKKEFFILDKNENFFYYYWKLLSLKQPIINLFTHIEILKTGESYIPLLIKTIRIMFYLLLNMLFNTFHLEQIYFRQKFHYFNEKYNIINVFPDKNISLSERFSYSFSHSISSGIISFIICFIIQSILNFFLYNSKNKLEQLKNKSNNNDKKIIIILNEYYRIYYLIIFSIKFIFILFICYSIINFTQVYTGGFPDIFAGMIWTFIFLQIFPFIYCIIFAFIIKREIKNEKSYLLKFGKLIYF